jgi:hypothetical protein
MDVVLAGLQDSAFAQAMRSSVFLYPLANVLHVLGALTFFAAVAAMDFRVLGGSGVAGARAFITRVRPVAVAAFAVQLATGLMLFAPEATHIGHNPLFQLKLVAILIGLANVLVLEFAIRRADAISATVKASAVASLGLWLGVATAGRLIAYF